jgi:rod shape-determining protein MreC
VIEGYDEEQASLLLKEIPFEVEVEEGQAVFTSGLGGVFPKNLLVGEVTEVVADNYGLTKTAYIKPAADFYEIQHVIIVERKMESVEGEEGEEE